LLVAEARHHRQSGLAAAREAGASLGDRNTSVGAAVLEHLAALVRGNDRDELGMHGRTVEALVEVLDLDLPVGRDVDHRAVADAQLSKWPEAFPRQRRFGLGREGLDERLRLLREVDEEETAPGVNRNG